MATTTEAKETKVEASNVANAGFKEVSDADAKAFVEGGHAKKPMRLVTKGGQSVWVEAE